MVNKMQGIPGEFYFRSVFKVEWKEELDTNKALKMPVMYNIPSRRIKSLQTPLILKLSSVPPFHNQGI